MLINCRKYKAVVIRDLFMATIIFVFILKIPSIYELQRVSSKIEKLWIEGNPLCDEMDLNLYIKQILQKFPRLTELVIQQGFITVTNYSPSTSTRIFGTKFPTLHLYTYENSSKFVN